MNTLLNTTLATLRAIGSRNKNDYLDAATLASICLATATLVEALKDQVADLEDQLSKLTNPKLLPAPKISLSEYNGIMSQVISEASKIRRYFD